MRIVLIGQRGPYSSYAFRHLVRGLAGCEVVALVEGKSSPMKGREHRWLKPGRNAPLHKDLPRSQSLVDLAVASRIPILQTTDINAPKVIEALAGLKPDLLVCVGFSKLFSQDLLDIAAVGCVNAHPSPLPKWRGPAPIFWQLKEGMEHLPVTLHWLDAKEDHGPILARGSAQVFPQMAGDDVYRAGGECAGRLLKPLLESMVQKVPAGEEQVDSPGPRAKRPDADDATVSDPENWDCQHLINFFTGATWFSQCSLLLGDDIFRIKQGIRVFKGQTMPAQFMVVGEEITVQCRDGLAVFKLVGPG
ncbi:MAG: hypothetical protein HOK97_10610 [Deltaproteobacteria bacterium]|nr:hypothetical protein [Deltaproteobacteria bacterium]